MDLGISGRVALITGGAQGIGSSITRHLLTEGVTVIATSRSAEALEQVLKDNADHRDRLFTIQSAITDDGAIPKMMAEIGDLGLGVDILVNNAGHTMNITDPFCGIEDWHKVFRLNFDVPVQIVNAIVPGMRDRGWGRIVNITSCAGLENSGPVTFSAVKAALTAYTRSMGRVLALEAPGIVMTSVFPGAVVTKGGHWEHVLATNPEHAERYLKERCPLGRFGQIDEIGPIVAVYCSQLASFCHGAIIPVDAGQSKHFMYFNYME